jgi:hypothetical protein
VYAEDLTIKNSYGHAIYPYNCSGIYLRDVTVDTTRDAGADGLNTYYVYGKVRIDTISISNSGDMGIVVSEAGDVRIHSPTFSGNTDVDVYIHELAVGARAQSTGRFIITDYAGTSNDDRIYAHGGVATPSYIQRDTADARSGTCLKYSPNDATDPLYYDVGVFKVTDGASNLTLYVYMKDDVSFNGDVGLWATLHGVPIDAPVTKTMTTSYVQQSITVNSADIATNDYVTLVVGATGTAGSVFVDDFSASN